MKTKTWKIGEYCKGGIITAEIVTKNGYEIVYVIGKEWDFSAGSNKGSNQSNAKEFIRLMVVPTEWNINEVQRELSDFLHDLTTSYYADQVMEWINEHSHVKSAMHW